MLVNILIVDDHQLMIDGIKSALDSEENFKIIGHANNGLEAISLCENTRVDLILMDVSMPVMDGEEATKKISQMYPATKVIAITMHDDILHLNKMIKAGAVGYLLKSAKKEELVKAINLVLNGEKYFSSDIKIVDKVQEDFETEFLDLKLTEREVEIIAFISKGKSSPEIAQELNISTRTVEKHRANIMDKVGVNNISGLLRYAFAHGII
jgi:two-component system nitrate/nitrite response regulator NarL